MANRNEVLDQVITAIRDDLIGGAIDMAKATAGALAAVARETEASSGKELASAVESAVDDLLAVTPSIAPVLNALNSAMTVVEHTNGMSVEEVRRALIDEMETFQTRLTNAVNSIAQIGAELIEDGDRIFTYSISSTVWAIFHRARAQGKRIEVVVTESRPGNEGLWNITELGKNGIPVTVGIDAAMGVLMRGCSMFIVGADSITSTGSALCKIGTYPAALVARELGVPVRIAADTSKFDPLSLLGLPFKVREMPATDIVKEGAANLTVRNPVFDITPAHLIAEIITERGPMNPAAAYALFVGLRQSAHFANKLRLWAQTRS
jgi:ribose 1,5-bisphosphate isomerase